MQSRALLMIEHRLIERMIKMMKTALTHIDAEKEVDPVFIDTVVDFISMYADRTHHGKEEDILFGELEKKPLSDQDEKLLQELINEHAFGRKITKELVQANARYRRGDDAALSVIAEKLAVLASFYPKHIEKEDKIFFPASMRYFSREEDESMLEAYWEFDRKMIHEKYRRVVQLVEAQ